MRIVIASFLFLPLVACRDTSHGDDVIDPDSAPGEMTIQQVQSDTLAPGSPVELKGVVVTAIDAYGQKTGDFWVQEPEGGPYSGVHVYGAPLDQVAVLALGDVVDIKGAVKDEFALMSDTSGNTVTELKPTSGAQMSVTKVSAGAPIAPQVVDALTIGQMPSYMARAAEWEKWEGVLVQVTNVSALSAPVCVGTNCTDSTLEKFDVTGDVLVESALAAFPTPKIARNDCLGGVTGVVDYFFDYQILPRTTSEVVTGGTACPPPEATALLCTDGIDNDGNGYNDCNDNNCIVAEATCHPDTTIAAIQTAATPPTGGLQIVDAYVAAVSKSKKNLWVQTSTSAAANEGIYVYGTGATLSFTIGQRVTVIGKVEEFNDSTGTDTLTEIKAMAINAGTAGTSTLTGLTGMSPTQLSSEPYESVFVTLQNVKLTTVGVPCASGQVPPACSYGVGAISVGGTAVKTDDDINLLGGTAGTCFASVSGIWTYLVYENAWGFLPLTTTGTGTGTCP